MRRLTFIACALVAASCACAEKRTVERIRYDVDGDGRPDTIVLINTSDEHDDGDFTRIDLLFGNSRRYTFTNEDRWIRWDINDWDRSRIARNVPSLIKSKRVALVNTVEGDRLLVAFEFPYASSSGRLSVFRISRNGVKRVLNNEMDLVKIADIDHDGRTDIVGSETSEAYGDDCGSYDPDVVYTLDGTFKLNRVLTERYDRSVDGSYERDHTKFFVFVQPNGKRVVLPNSEQARCGQGKK